MDISQDTLNRFWSKVNKTDRCWIWIGGKTSKGYGMFFSNKKFVYAHRFSYELHKCCIASGRMVCHACDNPSCVNPEHLFDGTGSDNQRDSVNKGRQMHVRKTHCRQGHPYEGENLYISPRGYRFCRECMKANIGKHMREKRSSPQFVENERAQGRAWYASRSDEWYQRKLEYNRMRRQAARHPPTKSIAGESSLPSSSEVI